jgi:predicted CoA-binding protein
MSGRILTEPADLRALLDRVRTIAVVGVSTEWKRPSSYVMKYLQSRGYRTIPVNPRAAGEDIWGERVYASLSDIPDRFDMVDIFRKSEDVPPIVDEAIRLKETKGILAIWIQLGIRHDISATRATAAGLDVVMDRCAKIEYGRHHSELSWGGFNTGLISAKRARVRLA